MAIGKLAKAAAENGLLHTFGVPGSGQSLELIDALHGHGVAFHSVHHEGAAAIMAGTTGRLSNRAGMAIAIKGPGLANMVGGMAACAYENLPMLGVTEAYGPDVPLAKAHKRLDQAALSAAVAKGRRFLAGDGPGYGELAGWAEQEAPGPVFLELAGQVGQADPVPGPETLPDNGDVLGLIERAERPVVIAGTLALRLGLAPELSRLRIPVFSTAAAKGAVDEGLPQAAGVYTGAGQERSPEADLIPRADLIVGIGLRPGEVLGAGPFASDAVNLDPIDAPGQDGFAFAGVLRDPAPALDLLARKAWGVEECAAAVGKLRQHLLGTGQFLPAHAFAAIAAAFPNGVRMVIDTGYFCTIGEHIWQAPKGEWCLSSGSGRYMGMGLPQAIAAAIHDPSVPTILAVGDGGIAPFFAEARLARRLNLPLAVLQMSDGGYGSVRTRAIADGLIQAPMLEPGASWRGAFDGIGFTTAEADNADALAAALAEWRPDGGPMFALLPMDSDAYQEMIRGVR
ncbi:MAG: thiamine pyrophosphate-binding protein [Alphaproteobacteria bacterium]|jgi:acetolactate synthase-1/2/3 large subunit|nr:thiamine pyrophosphate-binding protein [Alphaproteobacteria bacterium]MDP6832732.1 thiamine pyrophosphate-binding protein [Alphaproteobacteria bacterium]